MGNVTKPVKPPNSGQHPEEITVMRLAIVALLALTPMFAPTFARAQPAPRTPAPFTIVPLVELTAAKYALAHGHAAEAQSAIDRAAVALTRTQALAGAERMRLAGDLLMRLHSSRGALAAMREEEAQSILAEAVQLLRTQPHY